MQIRFIILIALVSLLTTSSFAKKKDDYPRADIKVSYNYHKIFLRGNDGVVEMDIPFILLSNNIQSKFYCPSTEYKDSLRSTPSGRVKEREIFNAAAAAYIEKRDRSVMDAVVYHSRLYVTKDFVKSISTIYDEAGLGELGYYTEPFSEIDWQIDEDSTRTVLGYECLMATSDYHGRKWTAWFSPEIPIKDGPWKLCALPGLIMEISESSGQHSFTATGIEVTNHPIYPIFSTEYVKMNRINMLRSERNYQDHRNSIAKASTAGMLDLGPDATAQTEYDYLETDYR